MAKEPRVRLQSGHGFMPSYEKLTTHSDLSSKLKTLVELLQTLHLFLPEQHTNELDFLQAQIQLSSSQSASNRTPMLLQIGRFTMDLGNRRLAARNRMRNTTNAFDGVLWRVGQDTNWTLRTFVSRPVIINPSDLDSSQDGGLFWGSSYTAAVTTDDNRKLLSWLEG